MINVIVVCQQVDGYSRLIVRRRSIAGGHWRVVDFVDMDGNGRLSTVLHAVACHKSESVVTVIVGVRHVCQGARVWVKVAYGAVGGISCQGKCNRPAVVLDSCKYDCRALVLVNGDALRLRVRRATCMPFYCDCDRPRAGKLAV